jgi:hypothetical protein
MSAHFEYKTHFSSPCILLKGAQPRGAPLNIHNFQQKSQVLHNKMY